MLARHTQKKRLEEYGQVNLGQANERVIRSLFVVAKDVVTFSFQWSNTMAYSKKTKKKKGKKKKGY